MDEQQISVLLDQCRSGDRRMQVEALYELSEALIYSALPVALELLTSSDNNVRGAAADVLGILGKADPAIVGASLLDALDDPDLTVRNSAAESVGLLGYLPAQERLAYMLLNDPEWVARASAAEALGNLGDSRSLGVLEAALSNDSVEGVRSYAAYAIGLLGDSGLLPKLAVYHEAEESMAVKAELLGARYRLGEQRDLKKLLNMLDSTDEVEIYRIINSLEDLVDHNNPPTLAEDAAEIRQAVAISAERFPALRFQTEEISRKLQDL